MPPLCRHLHLRYIQIPEIAYNQSLRFLLWRSSSASQHAEVFFCPHFATSTLQKELLVIIDQQKVDFILIFAAEIEKMQNMRTLF